GLGAPPAPDSILPAWCVARHARHRRADASNRNFECAGAAELHAAADHPVDDDHFAGTGFHGGQQLLGPRSDVSDHVLDLAGAGLTDPDGSLDGRAAVRRRRPALLARGSAHDAGRRRLHSDALAALGRRPSHLHVRSGRHKDRAHPAAGRGLSRAGSRGEHRQRLRPQDGGRRTVSVDRRHDAHLGRAAHRARARPAVGADDRGVLNLLRRGRDHPRGDQPLAVEVRQVALDGHRHSDDYGGTDRPGRRSRRGRLAVRPRGCRAADQPTRDSPPSPGGALRIAKERRTVYAASHVMAVYTYRYGEAGKLPGLSIGVTRHLPRGVKKTEYSSRGYFNVWLPNLAPSAELVDGYLHGSLSFARFEARYRKELKRPEARHTIDLLAAVAQNQRINLGCFCE